MTSRKAELQRMRKDALIELMLKPHHRRNLPDERPAVTHRVKIGGASCYLTVGFFDEECQEIGEVFIRMGKQGSTLNGLLDVIGILISYGLQYGVPLGDLCGKLSGMTFPPDGETSDPTTPYAASIIDYVFQWIDTRYGPFERPASSSERKD